MAYQIDYESHPRAFSFTYISEAILMSINWVVIGRHVFKTRLQVMGSGNAYSTNSLGDNRFVSRFWFV